MRSALLTILALLLQLTPSAAFAAIKPDVLVASARSQVGVTVSYDPAYRKLAYPGGDVPKETGVCSDVVVRALRGQGFDLQKEVHEDMAKDFDAYPKKWGLKRPDANIDHRRVLNLMTFFRRRGESLDVEPKPDRYAPGDLVAWDLGAGLTHIGVVSDRKTADDRPLIIHNIGGGAQEQDILLRYRIIGHFRLK
ncbi:MAG: DUF1287 domain-containing protein [Planctomycetota bacterium]|nr:DUF1287 domain-containing protein [Planctomycetota bacterium]